MKIAFIGGRDIRSLGGIEAYMQNLTRELVRLGHEPIVYCESDHNSVEYVSGVKVISWKGPSSNLICKPILGHKSTLHAIRHEKVDFIHYNAWPPSLAVWLTKLFGVPSCMEGHGLEWQRTKYSHFARRIMKMMEAITARTNKNLIMRSNDQVEYFRKEYNREAVCIHGAVNLPSPELFSGSDILERYKLEKGRYFLFLGRLVQDKNPDYLINSFRNANHDGYKLVIAGDNPAMPEFVNSLHSLAEGNNDIIFTGAVYGKDKMTLLSNAYCFCLPSSIEGLSIVMLEAASCKIPIIASNIAANKEFLGEDALFVAPENTSDLTSAIEDSIRSRNGLGVMIESNYQKVHNEYTWDKVSETYASYVESILNNKH